MAVAGLWDSSARAKVYVTTDYSEIPTFYPYGVALAQSPVIYFSNLIHVLSVLPSRSDSAIEVLLELPTSSMFLDCTAKHTTARKVG